MGVELIVALLGGGALGTYVRARSQNRLDEANAQKAEAEAQRAKREADQLVADTAHRLVGDLRTEMDRKVTELHGEVGRLRGLLESAVRERDHLREVEQTLRDENRQLRQRIEALEARVRELTAALEAAHAV